MKSFRWLALFGCIALLALIVPAGLAQDETFGLSDADYALFSEANNASASFDTLSYDFTLDMTVAGMGPSDLTIALIGSGVLGEQDGDMLFSLDVSGDIGDGANTQTVDFEVRLVGGMIYVNLGDGNGWSGGTVEEILGQVGGMAGVDPSALLSGDASVMGDMMAMPGMMDSMSGLSNLNAADYIGISRADADGLAEFTIAINIADLLTAPELAPLLGGAIAGQMGADASTMTEADMQQMSMMMGMLFSDLSLTYAQSINTSTSLVERGVLTLDFPLSAMLTGGAEGNINLVLDINLSGYNAPIAVEAPAEFTPMNAAA
jgi:hypothetical protein